MDPQKRIVYLMLGICIALHFIIIPIWMWSLGL